MKFGKRVRSLASPEWANDYVDYKVLKRHIKQVFADSPASGPDDPRMANFHTLLTEEMDKLNDAHARILDELATLQLSALQAQLGSRWVLPRATARALLLDVLQLSHRVDAFRRFVVLNSLALVKIAKKFDKAANADLTPSDRDDDTEDEMENSGASTCVTKSRLKQRVLSDLKTQAFYDGTELDALCDATAALTDRVMLCVLPDGNFRLGPRALTCPICLCSNVQAPITLSCAHTFCWSCLSRAAQHRFRSCPLCRRAQSVDPRDYEIDGLVKRFKRAYEFVEQALDVAPLVASPMRQILAEAFDVGNAYLREVEDQYAALAPLPSASLEPLAVESGAQFDSKLEAVEAENKDEVEGRGLVEPSPEPSGLLVEELEVESPLVFEKGDLVEVLYGEQWYAGVVLQRNTDGEEQAGSSIDDTYSVLWWVKDKSQRFGQRTPRHQLREPLSVPVPPALYEYAADAWRTAAHWALEPFRRLRSRSCEDHSSSSSSSSNNSSLSARARTI